MLIFALLCLDITALRFALLYYAALRSADLSLAVFGYNFARLCYAPLRLTWLRFALLRLT